MGTSKKSCVKRIEKLVRSGTAIALKAVPTFSNPANHISLVADTAPTSMKLEGVLSRSA